MRHRIIEAVEGSITALEDQFKKEPTRFWG